MEDNEMTEKIIERILYFCKILILFILIVTFLSLVFSNGKSKAPLVENGTSVKSKKSQEATNKIPIKSVKAKEIIKSVRQDAKIKELERKKEREELESIMMPRNNLAQKKLFPRLHHAKVNDYLQWLRGYIEEKNGKPTHVYDYQFP